MRLLRLQLYSQHLVLLPWNCVLQSYQKWHKRLWRDVLKQAATETWKTLRCISHGDCPHFYHHYHQRSDYNTAIQSTKHLTEILIEKKILSVRPWQAAQGMKTNKRTRRLSVTWSGKRPPCSSIISAKPPPAYTIICTMSKATTTQPQLPFSASLTWTSKPTTKTHKV